jgi:ubiquinone biosynthesis UbiH/UbiF/VisC/COQ6 family hydroxylase
VLHWLVRLGAVALSKQGLKVGLIDKQLLSFEATGGEVWDSRIYAISPGNADWLKELSVWQKLDAKRLSPIEAMEVWSDSNSEPLAFNAEDVFANNLGYIVESTALQEALLAELQLLDVEIFVGNDALALEMKKDLAILTLADGSQLSANLIVGADGGNSWVREQAGLTQQKIKYEHVGVVANFEVELSHQNIARQWFLEDGILAWLPLPGNRISMVFSTKHSQDLMELSPANLSQHIAQIGGNVLGKFKCITPPVAFPLVKQNASALIEGRVVLVGDAPTKFILWLVRV